MLNQRTKFDGADTARTKAHYVVYARSEHQSIRVTEKHYNPWVNTPQDALHKAVKKALKS